MPYVVPSIHDAPSWRHDDAYTPSLLKHALNAVAVLDRVRARRASASVIRPWTAVDSRCTDVVAGDVVPEIRAAHGRYQAIVLSGTKVRGYNRDYYRPVVDLCHEADIPVLGICGGMHILGTAGGAHLREGKQRVGSYPVDLDPQQPVFADAAQKASLFQRHTLYLQEPPPGYAITGWSTECPVEFIQSADGRIIGSQAHLEFRQDGLAILRGFARLFSQPILEVRMAIEPPLSEEALSWFRAPNLAYLATNEPDGQPQMTVVWVATSVAGEVIISTLKGRRKHINLLRAQQATILVLNPANVYSYCEIRGTATIDEDPGGGLIQELAQQYTGKPFTSDPPGAQRIIVRIRPHGVFRKD